MWVGRLLLGKLPRRDRLERGQEGVEGERGFMSLSALGERARGML